MQKPVRILNPVSDCHFTTKNRARRFVSKGRAVWIEFECSIRFVPTTHQHRSVKRDVDRTGRGYDLAAYDGRAEMQDLVHLPMMGVPRFLNFGKRKGATRHTFLAAQGM